ncbi:MAG TPA: hypothetical protein VN324_03760 [Quisquiliibacterium sp.]|nr:hypothetical protein [Quisquiliibacterium sp.]
MSSTPIGQTGLQGLRESLERAQAAASRVVTSAALGDAGQLTGAIVDLQAAKRQAEASAQVVRAADDTLGTLLDVMA